MMPNRGTGAKAMSFGPTAEKKIWAARKERLFAAIGGSAENLYDIENWLHPAVLKGEVRRYDTAVKQAVAANSTAAAVASVAWRSHVRTFPQPSTRRMPRYRLKKSEIMASELELELIQALMAQ